MKGIGIMKIDSKKSKRSGGKYERIDTLSYLLLMALTLVS